ncbi:MAG: PqqD family protein [Acidobacteria bacterium]|nr:PqqD family protein [Acidobacteriota bacterium]
MQTSTPKIVTKEQASFTELLDNTEGIILDLENLHYYTLNATAVYLWKQLRSGSSNTVETLAAALASSFNINADLAELDARAFLDELEGNGLVFYSDFGVTVSNRTLAEKNGELPAYEPPQLKLSNSLQQVTLSGSSTIATNAIGGPN